MVRGTDGAGSVEAHALVDTGAAISAIPEDLRARLGLPPRGLARIRGATDARSKRRLTYYVIVAIPQIGSFLLKVAALPRADVILGRDLLNQVVLHADGPKEEFDLSR
jgi:predicted aspartyl protease